MYFGKMATRFGRGFENFERIDSYYGCQTVGSSYKCFSAFDKVIFDIDIINLELFF